jgi:hypothetical protein
MWDSHTLTRKSSAAHIAPMKCAAKSKPAPGMRFRSRTSWRSKLEGGCERKVVDIPPKMQKQHGTGTMLIPRPLDVDAEIRRTRPGQLITTRQLRELLADRFGADTTCPLTTGIFVRIAAETAEEDARSGRERITPYWRVVGTNGELNPKFPGGVVAQARHLRAEGHSIARGGKVPQVAADMWH